DRILAHRTTVTGSIGVIMQLFNVSGTLAKIGMEAPAITSAENKAAGSPFKKMTSEQRAIFQTVVDELYADFVDVVDRGRPDLTRDEVVTLADGRVYTAPQALEAGLIDEISTMRGAVRSLKQELGVKQVRLVSYRRPLGYRPNYYARSASEPSGGSQFNLINVNAASLWLPPTPRFLYLWTPGG
ncbi:MAG: S49 family peptidase, partial [bacterium]|nr:S49 family peptidase [bacterium]